MNAARVPAVCEPGIAGADHGPRGRPREGRLRISVAVLGLVVLWVVMHFGCGRMPPEPTWTPTGEDSTAIDGLVMDAANRRLFSTDFNEAGLDSISAVLPGTTATRLRNEIRENPFKQRFRCDLIQHRFDSFALKYSLAATLDTAELETTCTVTFAETIPGDFLMHAYSWTKFIKDSVFPSGETLALYDTGFTPVDMVIEKPLSGYSMNGCVLRKTNGAWQLWKAAGGSRFYAPSADDAPYLVTVNLASPDTTLVLNLRPDTADYGVQRFYDIGDEVVGDSIVNALPTFQVGDTVSVTDFLSTIGDAANFIYLNGIRYDYLEGNNRIPLTESGLHRLFFVSVPVEVLYEMGGDYTATVWGATIRVKE